MKCKLDFLFYNFYDNNKVARYIQPHKHSCYELVYYIKGKGNTTINDVSYAYNESSIAITKPDNFHDEIHETNTEVLYIGFSYENKPINLNNSLIQDSREKIILSLLYKMKKEILSKEIYYEIKLDLLLKEIIIELERLSRKSNNKENPFKYVENFINENFTHDINLNTLAEISGYSYHRFRHLFKEKVGLSPNNYIIKKRITYAEELLQNTDLTISDISEECGFYDSCQFANLYKKYKGSTPTEYRNLKNSKKFS